MTFSSDPTGIPIRLRSVPVTAMTFGSLVKLGALMGGGASFMAGLMALGTAFAAPDSLPLGISALPAPFAAVLAFVLVVAGGLIATSAMAVVGAGMMMVASPHFSLGDVIFFEAGPPPHPYPEADVEPEGGRPAIEEASLTLEGPPALR